MAVSEFFLISGYLFYCWGCGKKRLKRQLCRLLWLYISWSIVYFPIVIYFTWGKEVNIGSYVISYIHMGLFVGFYYHLWYIPSLMTAFLLVFICDRYIKDYYTFIIAVLLFFCGIIVDNYKIFLVGEGIYRIVEVYESIFLTIRNGPFLGFLFVLLRKILAEHKNIVQKMAFKKVIILFWFMIALLVQFLEAESLRTLYGGGRANNMLFATLFSTALFFLLLYNVESYGRLECVSRKLRNLSTVIYFIHPAVMLVIKKNLSVTLVSSSIGITIIFFGTIISAVIYIIGRKIYIFKENVLVGQFYADIYLEFYMEESAYEGNIKKL